MPESPNSPTHAADAPVAPPSTTASHVGTGGPLTTLIVAANVVVFLYMVARGVHFFQPSTDDLLRYGANYAPLTTAGEWSRLFTSMFLHVGIIHVGFNMYILWGIGRFVEKLYGSPGYFVIYFVSGLAGSLASISWNHEVVSAGASGAVFGVFGAFGGFLVRHRKVIPPEVLRPMAKNALVFLGYNIVFGMVVKMIDQAAHMGGLVAGFVVAIAFGQAPFLQSVATRISRNVAALVVGAAALAAVASQMPRYFDLVGALKKFYEVQTVALDGYTKAAEAFNRGHLSAAEFADVIDGDVVPPWREERELLLSAKGLSEDRQEFVAGLAEYMDAREDQWSLSAQAARDNDDELRNHSDRRRQEADLLLQKLNKP